MVKCEIVHLNENYNKYNVQRLSYERIVVALLPSANKTMFFGRKQCQVTIAQLSVVYLKSVTSYR